MKHRTGYAARSLATASILLWLTATAAFSETSVVTMAVPGGGQPIVARTDSEKTIHLLYHSSDGPHYVASEDNGKSFCPPIAVVDQKSRQPGLEFDVWDMAVGPAGRVHVALGTNAWKLKLPQDEWGFFYARLDPGESAFTPVRNINRKPSEGFSLAVGDSGSVTACWLADNLYANVSDDHGETFSRSAEINPAVDPCNCCTTSAVYGADGRLAILYREETNNDRDMFLVLWDQKTNHSSRTPVSTTLWRIDACPMSYYTIAREENGFVAAWPTKGQIHFARLTDAGVLRQPAEIQTAGKTGTRTSIVVLTAANGTLLVAWKNNNKLGWQLYDLKGRPLGSPNSVESHGKGIAGATTRDEKFLLFR
ncbi:MAG: sialidase family protein [Planctomycetaceae bacterium]